MLMLEVRSMIRVYSLILITFIPTALMAEMSDVRRNTLLNICATAQKSSDLGTIRNVASQLKNAERPASIFVFKSCSVSLFGISPPHSPPQFCENIREFCGIFEKIESKICTIH